MALTFEEALESERKERAKLDEMLPTVWKRPAFELIHYNDAALEGMVETLLDHFTHRAFKDEMVTVFYRNRNATAKVLLTPEENAEKPGQYRLEVYGLHGQHDHVDMTMDKIKRDKLLLSKATFRKVVKEFATKDGTWVGAPWMVKVRACVCLEILPRRSWVSIPRDMARAWC